MNNIKPLCKLLLIEDDLPLASLISQYLRKHHCDLVHVSTGAEVELLVDIDKFDIILCDVMLPDTTGFELLPSITSLTSCPIIFLTALDENTDQIQGLELGAVDYIVKPIEPAVLLARIKVQLRHKFIQHNSPLLTINDLIFDKKLKKISFKNKTLPFTVQEFDVLNVLAEHYLDVVPREVLFEQVIGRDYDGLDRAVDLIISRLRKRFEELSLTFMSIRSIRGKGYLFSCEQVN
ncbi:response regulator transcription factor [Litorilituus lipolyticus]|uniref:Response regulator transcription factor n=1 Tax=Litorilituus lipolyticus TaxID=2491017 RepID=A0A502KV60_9GAMM|nr:response regulator transcription factor [Litorilituus lipolyticus]TPH13911.1 response regulator transcription factor [Litorilituus lipolyticus]